MKPILQWVERSGWETEVGNVRSFLQRKTWRVRRAALVEELLPLFPQIR